MNANAAAAAAIRRGTNRLWRVVAWQTRPELLYYNTILLLAYCNVVEKTKLKLVVINAANGGCGVINAAGENVAK